MESRICTKCNTNKPLSEYRLNRGNFERVCKTCQEEVKKARNRTKMGLSNSIYNSQSAASRKRGHAAPTYTKDELYEWLMSQELFHVLYDNWKKSGFKKSAKPSVDREDERIGYTMENITLMTWKENHKKHHSGTHLDTNVHRARKVKQYSLDGTLLAEYSSIAEASKATEVLASSISSICSGKHGKSNALQSKGFMFRYSDKVKEGNIDKVVGYTELEKCPRGVTRQRGKYVAIVYHDKKQHYIGAYLTMEEASEAYEKARHIIKKGR